MSDGQSNLTLRQRSRLKESGSVASGAADPAMRRRLRSLGIAAILLLLVAGSAWAWLHFHHSSDPRLDEVLALQAKISRLDNPMGKESFDLRQQIHEKMKDLPDDLKGAARQQAQGLFQARFDRFFTLSSKDQLAELDKIISATQAMQQMQKLAGALGGQPAGGQSAGGQSANSGGSQPPPGPRPGRSDAQRAQFMQNMISNHPPEQRGQFTLGRQMFNARLQQQGGSQSSGGFF